MKTVSRQLIIRATVIEGGLLGLSIIGAYLQAQPWPQTCALTVAAGITGIGAGLLLLGVNYLAVAHGSRYWAFLRVIKQLLEDDVAALFENVSLGAVAFIAIVSGVAEEAFFRGLLQPLLGIWLASLIFGLGHIWKKTAIWYGLYAAVIGVYFGGLYLWTGNLAAPMCAHGVNNLVAMLYYRQLTVLKSETGIIDVELFRE